MTAASNPAAELTEAEREQLAALGQVTLVGLSEADEDGICWGVINEREVDRLARVVERILAARLAAGGAATDEGLRARVEALCQGWESWGAGVTQECAAMLRDVFDAVPAPTEATTTERRLVRRGKCTCGEVTPENHWGHADGCRYFADSVYEDVPVSRAADTAAEEPRTEAQIKAEAWDEGAEATAEWMATNPGPSGIPHDPPSNPYDRLSRADEEAGS